MSDRNHHVIETVEVELKTENELQAKQVLQVMNKLSSEPLIQILEKCFKKLKRSKDLIRLNTVEIDLGNLSINNFEKTFLSQFKEEVDKVLHDVIQQGNQQNTLTTVNEGTPLETFLFFLKHGTLPWYADTSKPGLLSEIIQQVIKVYPLELRNVLPTLLKYPYQRQRLATLEASSDYQAILKACDINSIFLSDEWAKAFAHSRRISERKSISLWRAVFLSWHFVQDKYPDIILFERYANALEIGLTDLIHHLEQGLRISKHPDIPKFIDKLKLLKDSQNEQNNDTAINDSATRSKNLANANDEHEQKNKMETNKPTKSNEEVSKRPESGETIKEKTEQRNEIGINTDSGSRANNKQYDPSNEVETTGLIGPPSKKNKNNTTISKDSSANKKIDSIPSLNDEANEMNTSLETLKKRMLNYSESDELHIHHAGIVILGTYLPRLFRESGLVVEDDWINEEAKHQGVGVLHFLATGLEEIEEYQTPLLKVMCGLTPETPLHYQEPPDEDIRSECAHLLEAVIEHAAVLGKLSVDGLRGSYIFRPGLLSMRDGHWLVQVERRGYDILLNQLPWSFNLIKLPWLKTFIVTEWI